VYEFLGCTGLPGAALPSVDVPLMGTVGYHLRKGRQALKSFDWTQYMAFAERHFRHTVAD
jgi:hypothetical protein